MFLNDCPNYGEFDYEHIPTIETANSPGPSAISPQIRDTYNDPQKLPTG